MNFNSYTDRVVVTAVDLVNLLTEGDRRGRSYSPPSGEDLAAQLTALLRATGGGTGAASAAEAAAFAGVAARLRPVFESAASADVDDAARRVNELLAGTGAHPVLERHDGEPWHVHFHAAGQRPTTDSWAAGWATGLAIVLGGDHWDRLGVCTAPRCDRVYVDVSRNGSKRFCSTACQNRVKAAAFRDRRA